MTTLWLLAVAAVGFLFWRTRRSLQRSSGRKRQESVRRAAAAELREQDRRDCLELEESLKSRLAASSRPAASKPPAGAG